MDLDDRLRTNLRARAERVPPSTVPLVAVEARGRRRRRRRAALSSAAVVTALAGATFGAVTAMREPDRLQVATADPTQVAPADPAPPLERRPDLPVPGTDTTGEPVDTFLSGNDLIAERNGDLVLLRPIVDESEAAAVAGGSLSAGVTSIQVEPSGSGSSSSLGSSGFVGETLAPTISRIEVYTSADGTDWATAGSLPAPADDLMVLDHVAVAPDGSIVMAGTASSFDETGALTDTTSIVAGSTDLTSWSWVWTPTETDPGSDLLAPYSYVTSLATGPAGTVIAVDGGVVLDQTAILRSVPGADPSTDTIVRADSQGIGVASLEVFISSADPSTDPPVESVEAREPDEERAVSWEQLGLSTTEVDLLLDAFGSGQATRRIVTLDPAGTEIATTAVDSPLSTVGTAVTGGGFVVAGPDLLLSADGATWETASVPVDGIATIALVARGDDVVLLADRDSTTLALNGDPFRGDWDVVELPVEPSISVGALAQGGSGAGAAFVLDVGPAPGAEPVEVETGGFRIIIDEAGDDLTVVRTSDGEVIWDEVPLTDVYSQGALRLEGTDVILVGADGEDLVPLPYEIFRVDSVEVVQPQSLLLWSPDGRSWTSTDLSDDGATFVAPVPGSLAVVEGRVVLSGSWFATGSLTTTTVTDDGAVESIIAAPGADLAPPALLVYATG